MSIINYIKKFIDKYFLILFGAITFGIFIWLRFIRERLPREIPFSLSLLGFIILIELCIIYLYIVISLIRINKQNSLMSSIIDLLFKPLEEFDYFWKHLSFIQEQYKTFADRK